MDYPKFIVSNQKEESISIQRVKVRVIGGNNCQVFSPPKIQNSNAHALAIVNVTFDWITLEIWDCISIIYYRK